MAEQEAVANVVASAVAERECDLDRTSSSTQGESLLLPLLQELLDKKGAQQSPMNRSASSQSSEESATATVDSGTESGEDLRLLAAGICDTIDSRSSGIEPLGPGLLAEVQNALSRLAVSLQLDSASVDMDPSRRQSLLQLVARLQANLIVPTRPPAEKKSGRFARHKSRHNRHTVGVSSEELEAARKLMQEVVLRDNLSSQAVAEPQPEGRVLQKQHSEGSVTNGQYRPVCLSPQVSTPVKNATAKPFSTMHAAKSSESISTRTIPPVPLSDLHKSISEPSTPRDNIVQYRDKTYSRQSLYLEQESGAGVGKVPAGGRPFSECAPFDYDKVRAQDMPTYPTVAELGHKRPEESETDDDESTVKQSESEKSCTHTPTPLHYTTDVTAVNRSTTPKYEYVANGEHRAQGLTNHYSDSNRDLSSAQRLLSMAVNDDSKSSNRFNNKKLKMKRANTIDIPKPLNYYELAEDSDDSLLDHEEQSQSTRRSNYLALRGPIRVNAEPKTVVPNFEPKTENDRKFMAFIQKHNNNNAGNVSSIWSNKTQEVNKRPEQNWSRKFGHIKTIFEKEDEKNSRPSSNSVSSAKKFWQSADDALNAGKRSYSGPKVSKQGTKHLQSLFEQKQQESKLPWSTTEHNNVVTGTLKVESNFKPIQNNQLIQGKNYRFVPQPLPVNKFSHAPMSAFKPPPKRTPVQPEPQNWNYPAQPNVTKQPLRKEEKVKVPEQSAPLFLYAPKEPVVAQEEQKLPSTPWASGQTDHRVLNIAASKFENPAPMEISPQPVRKTSKEKVYGPSKVYNSSNNYQNQGGKDLSSPYLVKNLQNSRKMSDQYEEYPYQKQPENIITSKQCAPKPKRKSSTEQERNVYSNASVSANNYQKIVQQSLPAEDYHTPASREQYMKPIIAAETTVHNAAVPQTGNRSRKFSGEYNFINNTYDQDRVATDKQLKQIIADTNKHSNTYDYASSESSRSAALTPDDLDEVGDTPLTEYKAVSKVMTGPVSQQAVTVSQKTPKRREAHDSAARNLQNMLNISMSEEASGNKVNSSPRQSISYKQQQSPDYDDQASNSSDKNVDSISRSNQSSPFNFQPPESVIKHENTPPYGYQSMANSYQTSHTDQYNQLTPNYKYPGDDTQTDRNELVSPIFKQRYGDEFLYSPEPTTQILPPPQHNLADEQITYNNPDQSNYQATTRVNQPSSPVNYYTNSYQTAYNQAPATYSSSTYSNQVPAYQSSTTYQSVPNTNQYANQQPTQTNQNVSKSQQQSYIAQNKVHDREQNRNVDKKQSPKYSSNTHADNYVTQYTSKQYEHDDMYGRSANVRKNTPKTSSYDPRDFNAYSQQQITQYSNKPVIQVQVNDKPISTESLEINDDGESVVTTKLQIPVQLQRKPSKEYKDVSVKPSVPQQTVLSDPWQQAPAQQVTAKPSPRASPRASPKSRNALQKAKSSHSLAVPKQFEAGITRDELEHKKRTVEAYFGSGQSLVKTSSSSNLQREERTLHQSMSSKPKKAPSHSSSSSRGNTLSRSKTMPDVAMGELFDDVMDVDAEFENIFREALAK